MYFRRLVTTDQRKKCESVARFHPGWRLDAWPTIVSHAGAIGGRKFLAANSKARSRIMPHGVTSLTAGDQGQSYWSPPSAPRSRAVLHHWRNQAARPQHGSEREITRRKSCRPGTLGRPGRLRTDRYGQFLPGRPMMDGTLEWFAAVGTIIAAGLVAADLGRRITGWGFVLFVAVSISWVISGIINDTVSIALQNGALLLVNGYGVWRYLISDKEKKASAER